jgi:hypothetical protein
MQTAFEALWKSKEKMMAGWSPEPTVQVSSYNIYIGLAPVLSSLTLLKSGVSPYRSDVPQALKKVAVELQIAEVRTALGLSTTIDFSNTLFYFAITYLDSAMVESAIADSILVTVPPVGIGSRERNADNQVYESYNFGFCDQSQKWVKIAATTSGAILTSSSDFYSANITTEYTYDGTNVATIKTYPSDMTVAGSPAKLTSYSYSGSQVTKVVVSDSTV